MFSGVFFNESGIPRYVVLTNRQLAIYNDTRESLESPTPEERIRKREGLLLLNLNATLRRVICEDIFRLAVASNDVARILKYAEVLHQIDPMDTGVLANAALVLAKNRRGLNRALSYARIAAKGTAEFRRAERLPNTPRKIFETYFSEQKQQEAYEQNRAVALEALGSVLYQIGKYEEAEIALRKSLNLKPSKERTTSLIRALRKLYRIDEADALLAKINKDLEKTLEQKLVNEPFEDFHLNSIDGRLYNLGSLKGKVILINFWATWCGPCKDELPVLVKLYEKYRGRGLEILSISTDDDQGLVAPFAAGYKLTFPVFHDTGIKNRLRVDVIPTSIFVGRDGMIHYRKVGFDQQSKEEIEAVINHLITVQSVSTSFKQLDERI
jgi:thiol-disulfide isomerase/thioredoxin